MRIPSLGPRGEGWVLLQAVLGLMPDAPRGVLHVRDPQLPPLLQELTVRRLRIGATRVTLSFRRHEGRTLANLLAVPGAPLRVQIDLG